MATQIGTAASVNGLDYSVNHKLEALCDGSLLALYQTAAGTLSLVRITSPGGTPGTASVTQTFAISGATNVVGSVFVLNNGTTSSDVWVAWADNDVTNELDVAHGTYTASGGTWSWDNTKTSIATGALNSGFMLPVIVWTGTYLIVTTRCSSTNWSLGVTYTTTKNGSTGWATIYEVESEVGSSHCYPTLLHDPTNACTLLVYSLGGDTIYARVVADTLTPSLANLSARVALSGTVNVGAAGLSAVLDPANSRLHVVYINTASSSNPQYNSATYTTTSISAGTSFSAGTGSTTSTGPTIALDVASPPRAYIFWSSAAVGSAADVMYRTLDSPYASGNLGTATNLTNATATDNAYPHSIKSSLAAGYVPLIYTHAVSPWAVEYDNSITAASAGVSVAGTMSGAGSISATVSVGNVAVSATLAGVGSLTAQPEANINPATTLGGVGSLTVQMSVTITMRTISVSTRSQTWSGGPAGSPGTETDVVVTDQNGNGNYWGMISTYGAALITSWGPVTASTLGTNQTSLTTSTPDGKWHWLEQNGVGTFAGSEDLPYTLTELGPTGSPFRRYYKGTFGPDPNGFNWQVTACIYPTRDGSLVALRYDCINPTGSAIALAGSDGMEVALIGGMQQADSTWVATNGKYGTVGGSETAWPTASGTGNLVTADPDYVYITPAGGGSTTFKQITVKQKHVTALAPAWSNGQLAALVNASRLKLKQQGDISSFAGSTTSTMYLLGGVYASATASAIAADYLAPGTPTTSVGTFTSFSYDERAYVCAASAGSALTITADLTPANVSVRHSTVYKITGWTANAPVLAWGGVGLTPAYDYAYLVDTANQVLYVQLGFDVVASGATTGQRNNAALAITPGIQVAATLAGVGSLVAQPEAGINPVAQLAGQGSIVAQVQVGVSPTVTFAGVGSLAVQPEEGINPVAQLAGQGSLTATVRVGVAIAAQLSGVGSLVAQATVGQIAVAGVLAGQGSLTAQLTVNVTVAVAFAGVGALGVVGLVGINPVAAFAGVGAVTATVNVGAVIVAAFAGQGSLGATLSIGAVIVPVFSGAGTLTAQIVVLIRVVGSLSGVGSLGVVLTPVVTAVVVPVGVMTLTHAPVASTTLTTAPLGSTTFNGGS